MQQKEGSMTNPQACRQLPSQTQAPEWEKHMSATSVMASEVSYGKKGLVIHFKIIYNKWITQRSLTLSGKTGSSTQVWSTKANFSAVHSYIWCLQVHVMGCALTSTGKGSSFCYITTNTWLKCLKFQMGLLMPVTLSQPGSVSAHRKEKPNKRTKHSLTFNSSNKSEAALNYLLIELFIDRFQTVKIFSSPKW